MCKLWKVKNNYTIPETIRGLQQISQISPISGNYTIPETIRGLQRTGWSSRLRPIIPFQKPSGDYNAALTSIAPVRIIPFQKLSGDYNGLKLHLITNWNIPFQKSSEDYNLISACSHAAWLYHSRNHQNQKQSESPWGVPLMRNRPCSPFDIPFWNYVIANHWARIRSLRCWANASSSGL